MLIKGFHTNGHIGFHSTGSELHTDLAFEYTYQGIPYKRPHCFFYSPGSELQTDTGVRMYLSKVPYKWSHFENTAEAGIFS